MKASLRWPTLVAVSAWLGIAGLQACASGSEDSDGGPSGDAGVGGGTGGSSKGGAGGSSATGGAAGSKTGGTPGNADAGVGDAGAQPPPPCRLEVVPINTLDLTRVPAGPGETLKLRARLTGTPPETLDWRWSAVFMLNEHAVIVDAEDGALAAFAVEQTGRYDITVSVSPLCTTTVSANAVSRQLRDANFYLRVMPPRDSQLPTFETLVQAFAGTPLTADLRLAAGVQVSIDPQSTDALALPSYVRLSTRESSFVVEGESTPVGPFLASLPVFSYELLVIPTANVAPALFSVSSPNQIARLPLRLDPGARVEGVLQGPAGAVAGARVLLRRGSLPSTLATSAADGRYAVRIRPGLASAYLVPPENSGLPVLQLPANPGLAVPDPAQAPFGVTLNVTWATLPVARTSLRVLAPAGAPAAGTRVVLTLAAPLANAGTARVDGGADLPLMGELTVEGITNAGGVVAFENLPRARYHVRLLPPAVLPGAAETRAELDLGAGDRLDVELNLREKLSVSGLLMPPALAAGARVLALDLDAAASPATAAAVEANGAFVLRLDPRKSYRLLAEPPVGRERERPRSRLGAIDTGDADVVLTLPALPSGLPFTGVVRKPDNTPLPGAILQIYCMDAVPGCIDRSLPVVDGAIPLGEATSDGNGQFQLVLPDPGSGG